MPSLRHRPGDLIQNRYQVRKLLGSGAFGTVYGCLDTEIHVPVAVKELHVLDEPGATGERDSALKQFRAEATHLSRLRHPNIVSGHYEPHTGNWNVCPLCGLDFPSQTRCPEHGAQLIPVTSRHYLVMEYIGGPDLLQAAQQGGGKLPVEDVVRYAEEVSSALAHVHARGYVHRDIKPENIRLRVEAGQSIGEAVLLDFGIATEGQGAGDDKYGTRVQRHTQGGGTVGYAPESPSERRQPDSRSDIHALGMTLYHLLTACDPTEPSHLREMRRHTPADFVPEISDALDALVMRAVDLDPARRPQHGGEMLALLQGLDEWEDQPAPPPPPVPAPRPVAATPMASSAVHPSIQPFLFRNGAYARDAAELVALMDEQPDEGTRYLVRGEVENWLFSIGEDELAQQARDFRQRYRSRPSHGLEAFLQASGWVSPPDLEASPDELDFGSLSPDGKKTVELRVLNRGRGRLFGKVQATHPAVTTPGQWDGNRERILITFDAFRLRPGRYSGEVNLDSSAGQFSVPFEAHVRGPSWSAPFLTVVVDGIGGMLAGGLLRVLPLMFGAGRPGWGWLTPQTDLKWFPSAPVFGLTLGCLLLLWALIESILRRSCGLFVLAGMFAVLVAIGTGVLGNEILIAGDMNLRPFAEPLVGRFSAGAWAAVGAGLGASLGTLRRSKDLLSERILAIALAWLTVVVFLVMAALGAKSAQF